MRTKTIILSVFGLFAGLCPRSSAGEPRLILLPESRLWLEGISDVHPYSSTATLLSASIELDPETLEPSTAPAKSPLEALIRGRRVRSLLLAVPVRGLKSGRLGLDRNMYAALKAERFPVIRFRMAEYEVLGSSSTAGGARLLAAGRLSIAGIERSVRVAAAGELRGDRLRLTGQKEILMSDYGARPLMLMVGPLRTEDKVRVHFDLLIGLGYSENEATAKAEKR